MVQTDRFDQLWTGLLVVFEKKKKKNLTLRLAKMEQDSLSIDMFKFNLPMNAVAAKLHL